MKKKPAIAIDFDGVIHSYTSPWVNKVVIPDGPVPGAFEALAGYINAGFVVYVFSCRCSTSPARRAMRKWFEKHGGEPLLRFLQFTERKPIAMAYIDDRGVRFTGTFPSTQEILALKTWNQPPR